MRRPYRCCFIRGPAARADRRLPAPQRGGQRARRGVRLGAERCREARAEQLGKLKLPAGLLDRDLRRQRAAARARWRSDPTARCSSARARRRCYAVVDRNRDFKADEVLTVASGLTSPNGVAFKDGALYVAEISRDLAVRRRARLRRRSPAAAVRRRSRPSSPTSCRPTGSTAGSIWRSAPTACSTRRSARRATSSIAAIRTRRSSA